MFVYVSSSTRCRLSSGFRQRRLSGKDERHAGFFPENSFLYTYPTLRSGESERDVRPVLHNYKQMSSCVSGSEETPENYLGGFRFILSGIYMMTEKVVKLQNDKGTNRNLK